MEILVFLLVVSNLNSVFAEDVAIEKTPGVVKESFKVQSEPESKELNDQLAESSQSIGQAYGNAVVSESLKQDGTQSQVQAPQQPAAVGHGVALQNGLRHDSLALNPIQVVQSHQEYVLPQQQHHQVYLHPVQQVQILDAEALPLQQTYQSESPQALGYTSYVEHLSEKDEDEINSALKEGSVSDIKRLVPKSGISFKIYHNEKNSEVPVPETPHAPLTSKTPAGFSTLHHRIRTEPPASPFKAQPGVYQTLGEVQPTTPRSEDRGGYQNSQQLVQSHGQDHQGGGSPQQVYYTQPETHKTFVEVNGKSSFVRPHFKVQVGESNYNRQTTGAEVHQNLKFPGKGLKQGLNEVGSQKHWNFGSKTENVRAVKPAKPQETLHYATDPQTEGGKGLAYTQNVGSNQNFNKHRAENSFEGNQGAFNYHSNAYVTKTSQNHFVVGHSANAPPHSDQKVVLNRLAGNYVTAEGLKPGQVIAHPGASVYVDGAYKSTRFADSEPAKTSQHGLITHVPKSSYVDTKNSQTFDHQKALEGSTSFDIKNAIDTTGTLIHQTNYVAPTTPEIHSLEHVPKQQLTYIIPEIPTSTVVIDNSVHDTGADGHHPVKDIGHAAIAPQISYHADVGGKLYHPPQNLVWTTEHFKQGASPSFTPKDLHQQVIRLHLPKEEVFVKTPSVEFPTSVVSHVSIPHQKQPFALHYDLPFVKSIPQEIHFQQKTKTRLPANQHIKLTQPLAVDWSLYKSALPNYGMNVVGVKHELPSHVQETGKKIIPILVRKRKNRSNGKEIGVVYGKVNAGRRPVKPNNRQEKNVRMNLLAETNGANVKQFDTKGERKNEFSVSASYKVDRSSKSS